MNLLEHNMLNKKNTFENTVDLRRMVSTAK